MDDAIRRAVKDGDLAATRRLLESGANANGSPGTPLLILAARHGHDQIVDLLLERGADIHAPDDRGDTVLGAAVRGGGVELIRRLLARGIDVNPVTTARLTPLETAAFLSRTEAAILLLEQGANPNAGHSRTLYLAAQRGNLELVDRLLASGANPNALPSPDPESIQVTPLIVAILRSHTEVVKRLLENGADPNLSPTGGMSPLGYASTRNETDIARLIVEYGGKQQVLGRPDLRIDHPGKPPEIAALLNKASGLDLLAAAEIGDAREVREILDEGRDIEIRDVSGRTALMLAAKAGSLECARVLLDRGAEVSGTDLASSTALHYAAQDGHAAVSRLLLERGAAFEAQNRFGLRPLVSAALGDHREVAALLLEHGAEVGPAEAALMGDRDCLETLIFSDVDRMSSGEMTALMGASARGDIPLVTELVDRGADIARETPAGSSALSLAVTHDRLETARLLLERGAPPGRRGAAIAPLVHAIVRENLEMVRLLLEWGADPNESGDPTRYGPLSWAATKGNAAIIELLLSAGAKPDGSVGASETPLGKAARLNNVDAVRALLLGGASPNGQIGSGRTPIRSAILGGSKEALRALLDGGASTEESGDWSCTPLGQAAERGDLEMVRTLTEAGANVMAGMPVTPAHLASTFGHKEVAQFLREREKAVRGSDNYNDRSDSVSELIQGLLDGLNDREASLSFDRLPDRLKQLLSGRHNRSAGAPGEDTSDEPSREDD